jgi:hypothetical protein
MVMNDQVAMPETGVPEPQMGMLARWIALFTDPKRAFASVKKNWEWAIVVVLVFALGVASFYIAKPIYLDAQRTAIEERLENSNVPQDRQEEIIEQQLSYAGNPAMQAIGLIFVVIFLVVEAAILLFVANILLGGQTTFGHVLNMTALTWLVAIPALIVKLPLVLSKGSTEVYTSLAILMPAEQMDSFVGQLMNQFDIFTLWQVILSMLGVAVLAKAPFAKSAIFVGILWLIWAAIVAGLSLIGVNLGGM